MALPPLTPPPTPPSRSDAPATFITRADGLLGWLPTLVAEYNAFVVALEEIAQATNYNATSSSSVAIGTGSKSFTATTGRLLKAGQFVSIASASGPGNAMLGTVTSYDAGTGALVVNVTAVTGSGTKNDWVIALSVNPALLDGINAAITAVQSNLTAYQTSNDAALAAVALFRGVPQNGKNTSYTLALTDQGSHVYSANTAAQTLTLPTNATAAFPVGSTISIVNDGTNNITVSPSGGVTLRLAGTATTGSRTVTPGGVVTLVKVATDKWFISGTGLS